MLGVVWSERYSAEKDGSNHTSSGLYVLRRARLSWVVRPPGGREKRVAQSAVERSDVLVFARIATGVGDVNENPKQRKRSNIFLCNYA
jgi:hypothetical protein